MSSRVKRINRIVIITANGNAIFTYPNFESLSCIAVKLDCSGTVTFGRQFQGKYIEIGQLWYPSNSAWYMTQEIMVSSNSHFLNLPLTK